MIKNLKVDKLKKREEGQILVVSVLVLLLLIVFIYAVFNVGQMVSERMRIQNIADAAAYSGAVWEAKLLNFTAFTNRALIANTVTGCFVTAMKSNSRAWTDFAGRYSGSILVVPGAGAVVQALLVQIPIYAGIAQFLEVRHKFIPNSNERLLEAQQGLFKAVMGTTANPGGLVNQVMNDIGKFMDKDAKIYPSAKEDSQDNLHGVIFAQNYNSLYNATAQLSWTDLQNVTYNTMSSWTKGTESGDFVDDWNMVLFNRRDWALADGWESWLKCLIYKARFNFGVNGYINFSSGKIWTTDYTWDVRNDYFKVCGKKIYKPCTTDTHTHTHYTENWYEANLGSWASKMRKINKSAGEKEPSVWVVVGKTRDNLKKRLFKFNAGLTPEGDKRFDINEFVYDLYAVSRAKAIYRDPNTYRGALQGPNLFNPFWEARLVSVADGPGFDQIFTAINSGFSNILSDTKQLLIH
ncbi:MAG: Tad domain-containing protein [Thermodesulfobacteriota bacterium]|nr:Tad domain-containing protein [Thermodesulfobacteriota bacterium]